MSFLTPFMMTAATGDTPINYYGADIRRALGGLRPSAGILGIGHLLVGPRAAGANMTVDVAAGQALVKCSQSNDGHYYIMSTAVANVVIPAAPASGTRTHLIVAQVRDKQVDGARSQYDWDIECIADTGGGQPATPNNAYALATVAVAAAQSTVVAANITDLRDPAGQRTVWSFPGQVLGRLIRTGTTTSSSSEVTLPSQLLTVNIDTPRWIRVLFHMPVTTGGGATAVQVALYMAAGTGAPAATTGNRIFNVQSRAWQDGSTITLDGHHVEPMRIRGNFTFMLSLAARSGSGFMDAGVLTPMEFEVIDGGPIIS